jgi:hypothetical protein
LLFYPVKFTTSNHFRSVLVLQATLGMVWPYAWRESYFWLNMSGWPSPSITAGARLLHVICIQFLYQLEGLLHQFILIVWPFFTFSPCDIWVKITYRQIFINFFTCEWSWIGCSLNCSDCSYQSVLNTF